MIDEIEDMWGVDCKIDPLDLSKSARQVPELHSKYYPLYSASKRKLFKLKAGYKLLKADKIEFLSNPTEDHSDRGWEYPDRLILKNEINNYLDADSEMLKLELKIAEQDLLVEFLSDILKQLNQRTWLVKNIQDERKFMHGER